MKDDIYPTFHNSPDASSEVAALVSHLSASTEDFR